MKYKKKEQYFDIHQNIVPFLLIVLGYCKKMLKCGDYKNK